jgi:Uma2 family endonuclease
VTRKLVVVLEPHLVGHPEQGELLIEAGFAIQRDPDVVFGPDLSVVRPDMPLPETGWIEGAPDLAVEVLSPGDRWRDVIGKATRYLEAGTRVVWIIDPAKRVVTVLVSDAPPTVLQPGDTLEGGPVLPGLMLAVGELF